MSDKVFSVSSGDSSGHSNDQMEPQLFSFAVRLLNLPGELSIEELQSICSVHGPVLRIWLNRSRSEAIVFYRSSDDACTATSVMDSHSIMESQIKTQYLSRGIACAPPLNEGWDDRKFDGVIDLTQEADDPARGRKRSREEPEGSEQNDLPNRICMVCESTIPSTQYSGDYCPVCGNEDVSLAQTRSEDAADIFWQFDASNVAAVEFFKPFSAADSERIEEAYAEYQNSCNPQDGGSTIRFERGIQLYLIDFKTLTQKNLSTNRVRSLKRCHRREESTTEKDELLARIHKLEEDKVTLASELEQKRQTWEVKEATLLSALEQERHARFAAAEKEREALALKETALLDEWRSKEALLVREHELKRRAMLTDVEQERQAWNRTINSFQAEMEHLKHLPISSGIAVPPPQLHQRPHLVHHMQQALQRLIPPGHENFHKCKQALKIQVTDVHAFENVLLWRRYCGRKQELFQTLPQRGTSKDVTDLAPQLKFMEEHLSHIQVSKDINEVLLLHGTSEDAAQQILQQGFDDRMAKDSVLYGPGIYFSTDACKVMTYATKHSKREGYLIVARVLLGDYFLAQGPMQSHPRPPLIDGHSVRHDSIVAQPGTPNGVGPMGRQVHWEFVATSAQVFPELLVHFMVTP